jgi:hypothetical protein
MADAVKSDGGTSAVCIVTLGALCVLDSVHGLRPLRHGDEVADLERRSHILPHCSRRRWTGATLVGVRTASDLERRLLPLVACSNTIKALSVLLAGLAEAEDQRSITTTSRWRRREQAAGALGRIAPTLWHGVFEHHRAAIILTAAATLSKAGITHVEASAQAAKRCVIAGDFAFAVRAGIVTHRAAGNSRIWRIGGSCDRRPGGGRIVAQTEGRPRS